jgi:hypothetical protein
MTTMLASLFDRRFLDMYYIVNAAAILSYIGVRLSIDAPALVSTDAYFGIRREWEIIALMCVFLVSKFRTASTIDQFIDRVFLFGKTGVIVLLWHIDKRIMGGYMILYAGELRFCCCSMCSIGSHILVLRCISSVRYLATAARLHGTGRGAALKLHCTRAQNQRG